MYPVVGIKQYDCGGALGRCNFSLRNAEVRQAKTVKSYFAAHREKHGELGIKPTLTYASISSGSRVHMCMSSVMSSLGKPARRMGALRSIAVGELGRLWSVCGSELLCFNGRHGLRITLSDWFDKFLPNHAWMGKFTG